jgi:hypothetical protein
MYNKKDYKNKSSNSDNHKIHTDSSSEDSSSISEQTETDMRLILNSSDSDSSESPKEIIFYRPIKKNRNNNNINNPNNNINDPKNIYTIINSNNNIFNDDSNYIGSDHIIKNNTMCNPEDKLNKYLLLSSLEILCYEIIIPFYEDMNGNRKALGIPYLGLSLKFPNYMFHVMSYKWDQYRNTGIWGMIIYKLPNVPEELLMKSFRTKMWMQYYSSYIINSQNFTEEQRIINIQFNQKINFENLLNETNKYTTGYNISIRYDEIIKRKY